MSMKISTSKEDLFVVGTGPDTCYLYAPLRRIVVSMNRAAIGTVARYLHRGETDLRPEDAPIIEQLKAAGLFRDPAPEPPTTPDDYLFRPHEVTLFPTTRCNLRCVYCYADAGLRIVDMPWETAQAGIDFVIDNALAIRRSDFIVGFHGGGEPTMNWSLVQRATLYARERARDLGLDVKIHCATNGVLSQSQREFIAEHFTGVNISLDGPPDIQDRQRPLISGAGSSVHVMQTLRFFREHQFPFGVRVTLTANEASRLKEIVLFLHSECPDLDQIHVEPVWQCGRCRTTGERTPSKVEFIRFFTEAYTLAHEMGFGLFYSGARLDVLTDKFCAAPGDGFAVTPEGIVSSCFEVTDPQDPRAELFHYGHFDAVRREFTIDRAKVARLRKLRVENIQFCGDCFCKWHCAGDCLAKALPGVHPEDHAGSPRCDLNRELTQLQLGMQVEKASGAITR
jgi:uncharacterized protein